MITMGLSYLHGVAGSAVIAVLAVLSASLTLLPALLGFVGTNIDRWRVRSPVGPLTRVNAPSGIAGAASFSIVLAVVHRRRHRLGLPDVALFSLRLGFPDDGNSPSSYTLPRLRPPDHGFGPGFNGLWCWWPTPGRVRQERNAHQVTRRTGHTGVAFVVPAVQNPRATPHTHVFPTTKPQDKAPRNSCIASAIPCSHSTPGTGGVCSSRFHGDSIDQSNYISARLPLFIARRSPVVPVARDGFPLTARRLKAHHEPLVDRGGVRVMSYAVQGNWFGDLLNIPKHRSRVHPMINFAILLGSRWTTRCSC